MARPAPPCPVGPCPNVLPCQAHNRYPAHARPAWYQNAGRSAASRGYGVDWQAIRAQVLAEEPNCRECGAPATDVDHITPKARGGTNARTNLQSLCGACHKRKTGQESHAAYR